MVAPPPAGPLRREGTSLVATRGMDLGGACIKCGSPHAPHRRRVDLSHVPPAVYLTILLSLPVFVVVALLTRRTSSHWINLCAGCNAEWERSVGASVASALAVFGSLFGAGAAAAAGWVATAVALGVGGPFIGIAGLVVSGRRRLAARRITGPEVRIDGVSPRWPLPTLPPAPLPTSPSPNGHRSW